MSEKLLPCPFCGGTPIFDTYSGNYKDIEHVVVCRACDICLEGRPSETLAADLWNTRAPQPPADAPAASPCGRMREALEFIRDGYERGDINHVDYRVGAYMAALDALGDGSSSDGGVEGHAQTAPWPTRGRAASDGVADQSLACTLGTLNPAGIKPGPSDPRSAATSDGPVANYCLHCDEAVTTSPHCDRCGDPTVESAAPTPSPDANAVRVEISDEDMRDLLSSKDVGSGRAKLRRLLSLKSTAALASSAPVEADIIERCAVIADDMTKKWGEANGSIYAQGMQDQGIRIAGKIRALNGDADARNDRGSEAR